MFVLTNIHSCLKLNELITINSLAGSDSICGSRSGSSYIASPLAVVTRASVLENIINNTIQCHHFTHHTADNKHMHDHIIHMYVHSIYICRSNIAAIVAMANDFWTLKTLSCWFDGRCNVSFNVLSSPISFFKKKKRRKRKEKERKGNKRKDLKANI